MFFNFFCHLSTVKNKGKNVVLKYLKERVLDGALIHEAPAADLEIILVVPCYKEELSDLLKLCHSLNSQLGDLNFELIIVVNNEVGDEVAFEINKTLLSQIDQFDQFLFTIHFIDKTNITASKKAGVGLARKIGLDEGLRRFDVIGKGGSEGILVCLDADCIVANNYVQEIHRFFHNYQKLDACSIGFKHRFDEIKDESMLQAIVEYELHLRYYIQIQSWIGLPFAYQTVGSAMAIRAGSYAAQGGMPILKAGEDFYFLHKFIANNKCGNLSKSLVFPSGRISDRVPFGTGRAVGEIIEKAQVLFSYSPKSFEVLKFDLDQVMYRYPHFNDICASVSKESRQFFTKVKLEEKLNECVQHTTDQLTFNKRFYQWFDAFMLMKYVHFLRDEYFPNVSIIEAVNEFMKMKGASKNYATAWNALLFFQAIDYPNEAQL